MSNSTRCRPGLPALLLGLVLGLPGLGRADDTSDRLTRIEAETVLLKAREKQLDVQANIVAKQNDIAARQTAGNLLAQAPAGQAPQVVGVEGLGQALFATLQLADGNQVEVQAGDTLPNNLRVLSVASGGVIVQHGKKRFRLARYVPRPAVSLNPGLPLPGPMLPPPLAAAPDAVK